MGTELSVHRSASPALAADVPVFRVPIELVKILNRDLKRAGIPKFNERGRVLDVHCLRGTFATLLSKGAFRCERHKPRCVTAIPNSRPTFTAIPSFWTCIRRWTLCRDCRSIRRRWTIHRRCE